MIGYCAETRDLAVNDAVNESTSRDAAVPKRIVAAAADPHDLMVQAYFNGSGSGRTTTPFTMCRAACRRNEPAALGSWPMAERATDPAVRHGQQHMPAEIPSSTDGR